MPDLRICIDVDDLERGIAFYRDGIGLRPGRRLGKHWVEMLGAQAVIDLLGAPAGSTASPARPSLKRDFSRHWTPVHLDFIVGDLDEAVARALRASATLDRAVEERPYGRMANMADPFGNGFCLIEMNARGYDALLDEPEEIEA
jgi:predicted enzyme related to lactoylglutathione lyase